MRQNLLQALLTRPPWNYPGKDYDEAPGEHVGAFHEVARSNWAHEAYSNVRPQPSRIAEFHHKHGKRLNVAGILQRTCIHRLKTSISDKCGCRSFGIAIVPAIKTVGVLYPNRWAVE